MEDYQNKNILHFLFCFTFAKNYERDTLILNQQLKIWRKTFLFRT